ncbi:MAG TPA: peptidase domain-containing ABC transporter [Bacteroidia bacterium]|nr:peptidase domain-containing ABC transporter [Bacteroidia bacterium]HRS59574.1 peptidase domain-containing ABC transporter [Bacteroidia bacterium]HRU67637.1 peptidase domain-containing ABC transporter [Bacteroidia bacterium]
MGRFVFYKQHDAMDCGPTCLRMVAKHYGKNYTLQTLREKCFITREGVSLLGISDAAESIGFRTKGVKISFEQLKKHIQLPCIVHWDQKHFVVVYKITSKKVFIADPGIGKIKISHEEFKSHWLVEDKSGKLSGLCLILEASPEFYNEEEEKEKPKGFRFLWTYLHSYKKYLIQLLIGVFAGSIILLLLPFLMQQLVDYGINNQNLGFIYLILIAQLCLFAGKISVDLIRGWILLHLSTRVNVSLISDFLAKLMKLPIGFFDTKKTGDILQRIYDHERIESFLTTSTLVVIFSLVNLLVFSIVLAIFNLKILLVFFAGTTLYLLWVIAFLKRRRQLDNKRFAQLSENQSALIQLISGMQEIKLNNFEKHKRWDWENIQAKLFHINVKSLSLSQNQRTGAGIVNEVKNILITFITAYAVVQGNMSLGMMLAVQFIIGQMNSPVDQMINFFNKAQDAKISLERLGEIHQIKDEEENISKKMSILPDDKSIYIQNLVFQYEGPHSEKVLNNINLTIPQQKVTAIVGSSGSGKTTLMKLLLGFYQPVQGDIRIGDLNLSQINEKIWRNKCGAVMQDGFIFSDTILKNIVLGDENIDEKQFNKAIKVANLTEFIHSLPMGYNTKIGADGHGLSQGQKQRILIARAVYKDPEYLFFDEATNALDANNEKIIMNQLNEFFNGKTVVIIAHRLSTVKNADQIIVLERGQIIEIGTHYDLSQRRSYYYELVKNQLELG